MFGYLSSFWLCMYVCMYIILCFISKIGNKCCGDSEIRHEIVRDTSRIISFFSDFRVVLQTIRSCSISESPRTLHFLFNSVRMSINTYLRPSSSLPISSQTRWPGRSAGSQNTCKQCTDPWLATLAVFHQNDLKNRMNCTRKVWRIGWIHPFLKIILMQNNLRGNELNQLCPPHTNDDL